MSDNEAQWVEDDDGNYYYYYSDGTMATGWMQSGDHWYYFDSSGKMATGWNNIDGDIYYFYSGGEMATGWIDSGNGWYYLYGNGSMAWGRTIDEYLLDNNGKMLTGTSWEYVDGNSYYLKDGKIATGWLEYGDDNWSYLYGNGTMAWGRTVEGCYIDDNGNWVQDVGWHQEEKYGTWYYVDSNGNAVTGWQKIDNQWYYFDDDGKMQTGWINDNNNWYYLDSSGAMVTGKNDIGSDTYYFYSSGEMATGSWIKYGGSWNYYYGDGNGSMAHDTTIDGCYVNADGEWDPTTNNNSNIGETNTGWIKYSNNWYYYNPDGKMKTGWLEDDNKWYYLDQSSGSMQTGWQSIDGNEYYFDSDGHMVTDEWEEDSDGNRCYLNSDGIKQDPEYKKGDGNFVYDYALDNDVSLERNASPPVHLQFAHLGISLTIDIKTTFVTDYSASADVTEDELQFYTPDGKEVDLNKEGMSGSISMTFGNYKVQAGGTVGYNYSGFFIECSCNPNKAGIRVDLKFTVSIDTTEAIVIAIAAGGVTLYTGGSDIPAFLAGLENVAGAAVTSAIVVMQKLLQIAYQKV